MSFRLITACGKDDVSKIRHRVGMKFGHGRMLKEMSDTARSRVIQARLYLNLLSLYVQDVGFSHVRSDVYNKRPTALHLLV